MKKQLLQEGPVGHMWHPFDLDYVKNGKDLLSVFENQVVEYLNQFNSSIKIDGINGPIRLITKENGEKEFAIDRLSTAPLDVRGVTADRLRERFEKAVLQALDTDEEITIPLHKLVGMGVNLDDLDVGTVLTITHRKKNKKVVVKNITSGHGFVNDGSVALKVLNAALAAAPQEMERILEVLDMWDNPNICLNNDIVHESSKGSGQVNAVKYDEDFIAFHGLNEIFIPDGKRSRKTREIKLSDGQKRALTELVNLVNKHNPVDGFRALSPFDTVALKGEVDIDYSQALGEVVEIKMDDQNAVAKSIGDWLKDNKVLKPSYDEKYVFADGKKRSYFSKANYVSLIPDQGEQQYSVRQLLSPEAHPEITEDDYYKFASAAIFYHATRVLGRAVLKTLVNKSKVGNEALTSHEGVVMRSSDIFGVDKPIKITGDFIRDGMAGGIAQVMVKESLEDSPPQEIGDEEEEQSVPLSKGTRTVAIMPGSFKPPHKGHLLMAEHLSGIADEVLIFVSAPKSSKRLLPISQKEITYDIAIDLWNVLLSSASNNIKIVETNSPSSSPILALEQLLKPQEERDTYKDVEFNPEQYSKFYIAMSEKEKDDPRSMQRFQMYSDDPRIDTAVVPAFKHSPEYTKELSDILVKFPDLVKRLSSDIEAKAIEDLSKIVQNIKNSPDNSGAMKRKKNKVAKLPANATVEDYFKVLPKKDTSIISKMMKSDFMKLDKQNFSATDLRLLLDLKKVYNLPVDNLLKDFVGQNVDTYLSKIFSDSSTESLSESIGVIQDMVRAMLLEELSEMSTMAGGAIEGGSKPAGKKKKKPSSLIREEDDELDEANIHPSDLPISNPRGSSTITVTMVGSSRHRPTGVGSDAGYKKAISNKYKFDIAKSNMERAPYYDEGDIVTDLVEKVLRNLIRTN